MCFRAGRTDVPRLEKNWRALVAPQDYRRACRRTPSWGMKLEESLEDFRFLEALPGRKVLLKAQPRLLVEQTAAKMAAFFEANGLRSFLVLHNQSVLCEDEHIALCGTRGWLAGQPDAHQRQGVCKGGGPPVRFACSCAGTLSSGRACGCAALPARLWPGGSAREMLDVLAQYGVKRCFYSGHLHAASIRRAAQGRHRRGGIPPYQRRCAAILPL